MNEGSDMGNVMQNLSFDPWRAVRKRRATLNRKVDPTDGKKFRTEDHEMLPVGQSDQRNQIRSGIHKSPAQHTVTTIRTSHG